MRIVGYAALLAALLCAGCATTQYRPVVDSGVSKGNYEDDVADCQKLANQRPVAAPAAGAQPLGQSSALSSAPRLVFVATMLRRSLSGEPSVGD